MRNILLYRYTLLNALAIAWLSATEFQTQWFSKMVNTDITYITHSILVFFAVVFVMSGYTMLVQNRDHRDFNDTPPRGPLVGSIRATNLDWIERAGMWMLMLGLIGTIRGLQISLEGVNTGNLATLDGVKALAVQMISGLRIELATTLVGAGAFLWTEMNYTVIHHTAAQLAYDEERLMKENA